MTYGRFSDIWYVKIWLNIAKKAKKRFLRRLRNILPKNYPKNMSLSQLGYGGSDAVGQIAVQPLKLTEIRSRNEMVKLKIFSKWPENSVSSPIFDVEFIFRY